MKRQSLPLLVVIVLFSLAVFSSAQTHSTRKVQSTDEAAFDAYVERVSELSSRARANVYFPNVQSVFYGVNVNFVNVGKGNLTFLRRDLVTGGRMPLLLARVYDSSNAGSLEFGPGWMLSATETISIHGDRAELLGETGAPIEFIKSGNLFILAKDHPSDYVSLRITNENTIQAELRTGFIKEFKNIASLYRLTRVADRNG